MLFVVSLGVSFSVDCCLYIDVLFIDASLSNKLVAELKSKITSPKGTAGLDIILYHHIVLLHFSFLSNCVNVELFLGPIS